MKNEIKKLGRPVDENSKRQIELKAKAELRSKGLIKRGRPVVEGSKNQLKQERKQVLAEQGLLTGERGRPVNPNSASGSGTPGRRSSSNSPTVATGHY